MNLFIESLTQYLIQEWDQTLNTAGGTHEARFIVQSLDPNSTLTLFQALEQHRIEWLPTHNLTCYFRVATKLWEHWNTTANDPNTLNTLEQQGWIDLQDRFTWYRNRTLKDESSNGLIIVLVGLNHATDQGGLADFHQVDETRIWRYMEQSFLPWLKRIDEQLALDASEAQQTALDTLLKNLFLVRPLNLNRVAEFLGDKVIAQQKFADITEFTQRLFQALPFWDIPPLFADTQPTALDGKRGLSALKSAEEFISHKLYKTPARKKKDWTKINAEFPQHFSDPPATLQGTPAYTDVSEYLDTLHAFIHNADMEAKQRLLGTDCLPLLTVLKTKPTSDDSDPPAKTTTTTLHGNSFDVFLQAIWQTLEKHKKSQSQLKQHIAGIEIELIRFNHDLNDDNDAGQGAVSLARSLLRGCLGGLDTVFTTIHCTLPKDDDEAAAHSSTWSRELPITLALNLNTIDCGTSRSRPHVVFQVNIAQDDGSRLIKQRFNWAFGPTQPERVRFECAQYLCKCWQEHAKPDSLLPALHIATESMTALYFAADEDEANRLISQAMTSLRLSNLLDGLAPQQIDDALWTATHILITNYRSWLNSAVNEGFYTANAQHLPALINQFVTLAESLFDTQRMGSSDLLPRLYKAFLLSDGRSQPTDPFMPGAIVWGLSPAVLELSQAQIRTLAEGFPETLGAWAIGHPGKALFDRLLDLTKIQRPLALLVVDANRRTSSAIKSFGLLHYLGPQPAVEKSLAVQTLLRDEDHDDDTDVKDSVRHCEERDVVYEIIEEYRKLHPFAEDGLRILAVNVHDLATILAGVDYFLDQYLKQSTPDWPPFHCSVMVYSTAASPMAMEHRLGLWRTQVLQKHPEKSRPLRLVVGHRYAPKNHIIEQLQKELRMYDIAFLFHFLRAHLNGRAEWYSEFEFDFSHWSGMQFPMTEYAYPIRSNTPHRRQSLLSNRRLRIQTRHADLSARLCYSGSKAHQDHVVCGAVEYSPWSEIVNALHQQAQWVACVDPFVDKRLLLCTNQNAEQRKIVGFSSGLGAYGELNLTLSTEQDTLERLTKIVTSRLSDLVPTAPEQYPEMAKHAVEAAEDIIGLSSLKAVLGEDERIREVLGFAAISRLLSLAPAHAIALSQLIPVDAMRHWQIPRDGPRADLLQLSLIVRPEALPLIRARVIECKFAQNNPVHLAKASEQVQESLRYLSTLLAPRHERLRRVGFDRRYWWAQLHRAITTRAEVNLSDTNWQSLNQALEQLAEGRFEIHWQGTIFTFWTNLANATPELSLVTLPRDTFESPFVMPPEFGVQHVSLGYEGLVTLLSGDTMPRLSALDSGAVVALSPEHTESAAVITTPPAAGVAPDVDLDPEPEPVSVVQPIQVSTPPSPPPTMATPPVQTPPVQIPPPPPPTNVTPVEPVVINTFNVPEKILIGTRNNGEPVYWHYGHSQLPNRHLIIFGSSGSGKTYGIQCLLAEMAEQQLHSLIVDYTDGFLPAQVEPVFAQASKPHNHFVITEKLPLNPFRRQRQIIDPSIPAIEESPYHVATRIQSIFASIFVMGDQQTAALIRALQSGLEEDPQFTLDDLLPRLQEDGSHGVSLANKLEPLIRAQPFRIHHAPAWEQMLMDSQHWVQILQLKGLARDVQKMVTELVLWDLWDYAQNSGSKNRPIPIVLDEIQNLDHSSDSPIDKMLREGRKFGLSLLLATQTTSQFNQEQRDRLFQAGHKLFFKPAATEIDRFAHLLAQATPESKNDWAHRLTKLEKGQCWSVGPVLQSGGTFREQALLVNVTALEQRTLRG